MRTRRNRLPSAKLFNIILLCYTIQAQTPPNLLTAASELLITDHLRLISLWRLKNSTGGISVVFTIFTKSWTHLEICAKPLQFCYLFIPSCKDQRAVRNGKNLNVFQTTITTDNHQLLEKLLCKHSVTQNSRQRIVFVCFSCTTICILHFEK